MTLHEWTASCFALHAMLSQASDLAGELPWAFMLLVPSVDSSSSCATSTSARSSMRLSKAATTYTREEKELTEHSRHHTTVTPHTPS